MESLHPRMYLTHVLLSPKGHSPGWGHPGWSPEKNPQQYPGDAGTDEPDPVGGGLTFTCLGSPLPPGPAPSAPPSRPPVLGPPQGQQPSARRPPATGRTKQRSSQETSPRICATHMMEKKGMGTEENRSWEGAGNTEEYFLKRILIRKAIIVLGGKKKKKKKKGLGRSMQFVPSEIKSSFSPTPSGKVTWRAPRNTFRKTNVKGRDRGRPSLLSLALLFQVSLNSHVPSGWTGGQAATPGTSLGTSNPAATGRSEFFCLWRIF